MPSIRSVTFGRSDSTRHTRTGRIDERAGRQRRRICRSTVFEPVRGPSTTCAPEAATVAKSFGTTGSGGTTTRRAVERCVRGNDVDVEAERAQRRVVLEREARVVEIGALRLHSNSHFAS